MFLGESQPLTVLSASVCFLWHGVLAALQRTHTKSKHKERHCKQLAEVPGNQIYTRSLNGIKIYFPFTRVLGSGRRPPTSPTTLPPSPLSRTKEEKPLSLSTLVLVGRHRFTAVGQELTAVSSDFPKNHVPELRRVSVRRKSSLAWNQWLSALLP